MAREQKKVSVIIPSYNYGAYLPECIGSLLNQSYPHWEAVIVDDGSTDDTPQVAKRLLDEERARGGSRLSYFRVENGGVARARNIAVEQSKGAYILPLDADDMIVPEAIEEFVEAIESDESIGFVYSALENYGALPGESRSWFPGIYSRRWILQENLAASTTLFRRSVWERDVRFRELIHEDWDFWLQIVALGYRGHYIPKRLLRYRMHPYGRHSRNRHMHYLAWMEVVKSNPSLYPPQLSEAAKQITWNLPGALKKASVVFLPDQRSAEFARFDGRMFRIAQEFIQRGHFVAAVGAFQGIQSEIPGLALVSVKPEAGIDEILSRIGGLGAEIIVWSALQTSGCSAAATRRIRACANVKTIVSLHEPGDETADLAVEIFGGELHLKTPGALPQSSSSALALDEIVDQVIEQFGANRERLDAEEDRFRRTLKGLSLETFDAMIEAGSQISDTLARIETVILGKTQCERVGESSDWVLGVDSDVVIGPEILSVWRHYEHQIQTAAIYLCEGEQQLPGGSHGLVSQEIECRAAIIPAPWLHASGILKEPWRGRESWKELMRRAELDGLRRVWLPSQAVKIPWPSDHALAQSDGKNAAALSLAGMKDLLTGREEFARMAFEAALELNPRSAEAAVGMSQYYLRRGVFSIGGHFAALALAHDRQHSVAREIFRALTQVLDGEQPSEGRV